MMNTAVTGLCCLLLSFVPYSDAADAAATLLGKNASGVVYIKNNGSGTMLGAEFAGLNPNQEYDISLVNSSCTDRPVGVLLGKFKVSNPNPATDGYSSFVTNDVPIKTYDFSKGNLLVSDPSDKNKNKACGPLKPVNSATRPELMASLQPLYDDFTKDLTSKGLMKNQQSTTTTTTTTTTTSTAKP